MAIQFVCSCGNTIDTPDHAAGRKGRCPRCLARFIVPMPEAAPLVNQESRLTSVGAFMDIGAPQTLPAAFPQGAARHLQHAPAAGLALPDSSPQATPRQPRPAFQPFRLFHAWRAGRRPRVNLCARCGLDVEASGDPSLQCRCGSPESHPPKRAPGLENLSQVDLRIVLAFLGGRMVDR